MAPQREWFEKDYYKVLGVVGEGRRQGDHPGLPEAGPGEPPRRQPGRRRGRGALQGDLGRLRRGRRRREAQGVRRGPRRWAHGRRLGGPGGPRWLRRARRLHVQHGRHGRRPRRPPRRPVRRRRRAAGGRPRATGPQRGADLEAELHLAFTDAVAGLTTTLHLVSDAVCHLPRHRRRARHRAHDLPATARGRGVVDDNQGFFATSAPVPRLRRARACSSRPVPELSRARASSAGPARSRSASPPASPTASASGSRAAATPAATAARPATCS